MSSAVKPEIYASWIPNGKVAVKPLIFATVYRAPQRVSITGATSRVVAKTDKCYGDLIRKTANSIEINGDSTRKILNTENITGDTNREIKITLSIVGDSQRFINRNEYISSDLLRTLKKSEYVLADTFREVFAFEPEFVIINGSLARKITATEKIVADTIVRVGSTGILKGDTKRAVRYDVLTAVAGDTNLKLISTEFSHADTFIKIASLENICADSFRQIGISNSISADVLRAISNSLLIRGDTKIVHGVIQNISADILRQINYAIWSVTPEGSVVQINLPKGNHIQIGNVHTLNVDNWKIILDDRQTLIETIGGVIVEDFGHFEQGDNFSCDVNIRASDKDILFGYWNNRTPVTVIDAAGVQRHNCRVIVKEYHYIPHFEKYYNVKLEIWRK